MRSVRLFCWDAAQAQLRAREIRRAGYRVEIGVVDPAALRELRMRPPEAVIIDLTRAPAQGRDVGIYLRHYKTTRWVPIVFVGGDRDKVAAIKKHLPDAVYTLWKTVVRDLGCAISNPPTRPAAVKSLLAGYSGVPLVKKLGIKSDSVLTLISAPKDFTKSLKGLPEKVTIRTRISKNSGLIVFFVTSRKSLVGRLEKISGAVDDAGIWIAWPKQGSGMASGLSQQAVREAGLNFGLVDYKVCAIDDIWSGLKFARRKRMRKSLNRVRKGGGTV